MLTRHDELYMCMQDINTIPNVDTNGFWMFNFMSQIVPERDKIYSQLQLHYSKGNYFYFIAVKPIRMLWI
jgi:hypothetical protein